METLQVSFAEGAKNLGVELQGPSKQIKTFTALVQFINHKTDVSNIAAIDKLFLQGI